MINKLKLGFLVTVLSLAVGVGFVYAAEVNFTNDTGVSIGGNNYTIVAGSVATGPLVLDATSLSVVVPAAGTFTFSSADRFNLGQTGGAATCDGATNTVVVTGPASVTFTPVATAACAATPAPVTPPPSNGGGGGGGHTGTSTTPEGCTAGNSFSTTTGQSCGTGGAVVMCNPGQMFSTTTGQQCTSNNVVVCNPGQMFSTTTGQQCTTSNVNINTTVTTNTTTGPFSYAFGLTTVRLGSKGASCRAWQKFFNDKMNAQLVLDGNCGPKSIAAAKSWQASVHLVADGILGPKSRAAASAQGMVQ